MSAFLCIMKKWNGPAGFRQAGFKIAVVPQARLWHKILPDERGETVFGTYLGFSKSFNIYKSLRIWEFHLAARFSCLTIREQLSVGVLNRNGETKENCERLFLWQQGIIFRES